MTKLHRLLLALLTITLLASACSSDADTSEETSTSESEPATDEAADPADTGFVYADPFGVFELDPSSAFGTENILLQNVYETLTYFNPPGSDELLSPGLAASWSSSDDSLTWTFNLREDVTFHDGSPLNADTVIASLQRTIDLDLGAAFILLPVIEMTAVDDLTVEFALEWPTPLDLAMSSNYGAYIMGPDAVTQDADWFNAGNANGTGPYTISSYSPAESTVLTQFEDYWGGWTDGQITEVEIQLVEDPVLAEQMVRNGDADYTYNLPFDSYTALEGEDAVSVVRGQSMTNLFGMLNHERLSPEMREALVLSFPYDDIVTSLYGGEATRAQGIIPQAVWGSSSDLNLPETDLDRAAELVAAAGADGSSITYSFDAGTTEQQQIGEVWKANLATIGVNLVLEPLTFDARLELAQSDPANAQDIFTMFWFPTIVSPYDFMFSLFHSEDAPFFNLGYYSNEDFDFAIDDADALTATDQDAAIALFQEAQQMLLDDNAAVFMVDVPDVAVIASDIDGHVQNPAYANVVRFHNLTRG